MAWLDWGQVVNLGGTDTSQTVTGLDIGAADPDRWILVGVISIGNAGNNITSVTVGGVTATQLVGGNQPPFAAFYKVKVPTGTTANVVVNYNGTFYSTSVAVARFIGEIQYSSVHVDLTITSSAHSVSINVPSDGYAYGVSHWYNTTATVSWSGLTEDFEGSTSSLYFSGASLAFPSGATGETVATTYTSAPSQNDILAVVTFTLDDINTGTGAITTGAATVSGTGTVTPGSSEVTGSGDVDGTAATVSGTGEREITSSGAVNAPTAVAAGAGERSITATGAVDIAAATIAGAGAVSATVTGSGAVDVTAATVAGAGERDIAGTGAVDATAATVAGTGERAVTASGDVDVPGATASGTGEREITASGSATAAAATASGTGEVEKTGTGAVVAPVPTAAGTGEREITSAGAASTAAAVAAGAAEREVKGTGAVSIAAASVNGAAAGIANGIGVVVTPAATVSGTATKEINLPTTTVSPSPFLGVAFPTSDTSTYAFLGENGFGHIRIGAQWSLIQPSEGTWNWTGLDGRVSAIVAAGMQPFLTIASNASWAVDEGDQTSLNKMPVDIADWELFVSTLAARYDGSVYNYQLANEFAGLDNASGGWASTKEDLVTYIDAAYTEIKANASGTTVYMGGVASLVADIYIVNQELATFEPNQPLSETTEIRYTVAEARGAEMDALVANRLEYPLANATFDAASVHLYGDRSYDPLRISAIQSAAGDVPIITTESGAPTWTGVDPTDEELFVAAAMPTLGALADGIDIAFWFRDYGGDTTFYNQHVPLRDDAGDPKPSMWALRLLAMHLVDGAEVEEYDTDVYLVRNTPYGDTLFGYWSDMSTAPGIADFTERYVLTDPANGVLQHLGPSETPSSGDFVLARGGTVGRVEITTAEVAGTAEREVTGTGNVVAFVAVTGGTASREVTGSGAVVVPFATVAGSEEAEEEAPQQPGGFIPRPVIYVDEDGNPIEPGSEKAEEAVAKVEKAARAAVKAAPPRQKQEVKAAVDRAAEQIVAGMAARVAAEDAAALLAQLRRVDEQLAALIRQQMDDDEAAAVLLLFAA